MSTPDQSLGNLLRPKRVLPPSITSWKDSTDDEDDVSTSQSSDCAPGYKEITREVLLNAKDKLQNYTEREDPSVAKHGPKYEALSQTPPSSQVSAEEITLSQESFNDEISLPLLVKHMVENLGRGRIKALLKNIVCIKPEDEENNEAMQDFLVNTLNDNSHAALLLVNGCLALSPPRKRVRFADSPLEAEPVPPPTP